MIETDPDLRAVEATLFASDQPMTVEQIRGYVGDSVDVVEALTQLAEHYEGRGIELVQRARHVLVDASLQRRGWRAAHLGVCPERVGQVLCV